MQGSDRVVTARVDSITEPGFKRLLLASGQCAVYRHKELVFRLAQDSSGIRCDIEDDIIGIYLQDKTAEFEHHAAHELCHAIAGCCGFSYRISLKEGWKNYLSKNWNTRPEQEDAIERLKEIGLGSFLTHAAVHKLLLKAGYTAKNWDRFLLDEVQRIESLQDNLVNRTINVGWAIQYEELEKLRLPGLDPVALKKRFHELSPKFDEDLKLIRSSANIGDLLDVEDCLESTRSLAIAFGELIDYPLAQKLNIDIACRPTQNWNLDTVTKRLSRDQPG